MVRSTPETLRFTDIIPPAVDTFSRWALRYVESTIKNDRPSQISTLLGAATVLIRTNGETGVMAEPTKEEKDLAAHILNVAADRGYKPDETIAALIGVADGLALASVRIRE